MASLTDYFERKQYRPKYHLGDRVCGRWNRIPFTGTVGNDRVTSDQGPEVTVHLDLPLMLNDTIHHVLVARHRDVKPLPAFDHGKKR